MKSVMELLYELRVDHDLTQAEVGAVLGISQQHYSKYETGEYELPLRHFVSLANYYQVSADYLIGRHHNLELKEEVLSTPIYPEHQATYLQECLENLAEKGIQLD